MKKDVYITKTLPKCTLYEEDIEEILSVIGTSKTDFAVEGYRELTLKELKEMEEKEFSKFEISTHEPYIRLKIGKYDTELTAFDNSNETLGKLERITSIINKRKHFIVSLFFFEGTGISSSRKSFFSSLFIAFFIKVIFPDLPGYKLIPIWFVIFLTHSLVSWILFVSVKSKVKIVSVKTRKPIKDNLNDFFKHPLVIALLSVIAGTLLGYLLGRTS